MIIPQKMCSREGLQKLRIACQDNDLTSIRRIARQCGYQNAGAAITIKDCRAIEEHIKKNTDASPKDYEEARDYTGQRFPLTQRPLTNMYNLSLGLGCHAETIYLPVVRYATEKGGLYYGPSDPTETDYCGLFYFYEPSSSTFLDLGETLLAASKIAAFLHLWENPIARKTLLTQIPAEMLYQKHYRKLVEKFHRNPDRLKEESYSTWLDYHYFPARKTVAGSYELNLKPDDLPDNLPDYFFIYTHIPYQRYIRTLAPITSRLIEDPSEIATLPIDGFITFWDIYEYPNKAPDNYEVIYKIEHPAETEYYSNVPVNALYYDQEGNYKAGVFGALGLVDGLDQPLCVMARAIGIDTIIFQHEAGEERPVTEILDTRSVMESYQHLCRVKNPIQTDGPLPTIWFPSQGVYQYNESEDIFSKTTF